MGKEQRRSARIKVELPVRIIIRANDDDDPLASGEGRISDISRHGLRLTVAQAKVGEYHLFYSFHDRPGPTVYLTGPNQAAEGKELPEFTLPVRPVWFDRLLSQPDKPFQLGMEFLQEPAPEVLKWLGKMVAQQQSRKQGGWWQRLFGRR